MNTPFIGEYLKQIENLYGGSLNHWVGGLVHITVQTRCVIQYLTMKISCYMNSPTEPAFLSLIYGMEYLMYHPQEDIIYSRNNIFKLN